MNNKHFKRLLKESITSGASSLFEEEEVEVPDSITSDEEDLSQETEQEKENNDEPVSQAEKELLEALKKNTEFAKKIQTSQNFNIEAFARIFAHYNVLLNWDDKEKWNLSVANNNVFNKNIMTVLDRHIKKNINIICTFSEVVNWISEYAASKNPKTWIKSLRTTQGDQVIIKKLADTLKSIEAKKYDLNGTNIKWLTALISRAGKDFQMKECPPSGTATTKDNKDDKEGGEKDEATEEFQKLDLKVGDVVVVKNRNGKEIVTTVSEIPDELVVKENQWKDKTAKFIIGGDWSIPLDGKRGFNSKGQHWIAIRDKKVAIRKATTQDIQKAVNVDPRVAAKLNLEDTLEDAETEEIPREDVETYGTPEDPQAFRSFLKGLEKVPVINNYADEIVAALKTDIPTSRQAGMMPSTIDELLAVNEEEEQEAKYKLPDSENIQNIIKKITNDKLVAGKWAYTLIKRFLSRNGMDLRPDAERIMMSLKVIPKPEDIVPLLKTAKAVERNLEEQRYNMLLKRFNIK